MRPGWTSNEKLRFSSCCISLTNTQTTSLPPVQPNSTIIQVQPNMTNAQSYYHSKVKINLFNNLGNQIPHRSYCLNVFDLTKASPLCACMPLICRIWAKLFSSAIESAQGSKDANVGWWRANLHGWLNLFLSSWLLGAAQPLQGHLWGFQASRLYQSHTKIRPLQFRLTATITKKSEAINRCLIVSFSLSLIVFISAQTQFPISFDILLSLKQLPLPERKGRAALQKAIHLVFHCPLLKEDYGFRLRLDYCPINKTLKKPQRARLQHVCGTDRACLLLCAIVLIRTCVCM